MVLGPAAPSPSVIEVLTGTDRLAVRHPAAVAARQARLVGGLQHDIVTGATESAVQTLRQLAPTYDQLAAALAR
jgi:hypothetical protein